MKKRYSASALADYYACRHLPELVRREAAGLVKKPMFRDPFADALAQRGAEHELRQLERLTGAVAGHTGIEGGGRHFDWDEGTAETTVAMRRGVPLIYQGTLMDETWCGRTDFLVRVEEPSALGAWSYEVVDAKLSLHAKPRALVQLCVYSDLLRQVLGRPPRKMRLLLGDDREEAFATADFEAYFRRLRAAFLAGELQQEAEPVEHCKVCDWSAVCRKGWRDSDHLSLIAGITRGQRKGLVERGITTVAALAAQPVPLVPRLERGGVEALERVQRQAQLQVAGRVEGRVLHELVRPVEAERGLASLPEPSPGDLFFDIEGAPFAGEGGLEYLLGVADVDGVYRAWWADDAASEKAAFEAFIDDVVARLARWPALHVYHYAPYEPIAVKKLMGRHATREAEVDRLLRAGVFVDLYRAVRQGVRASVESYSIKRLEPLYEFVRAVDLDIASRARMTLEVDLMMGRGMPDAAVRRAVEGYNKDDCVSALRLRDWLEQRRGEAGEVPRPEARSGEPSEGAAAKAGRIGPLYTQLIKDVHTDEAARTPVEQARWLLAQLLEWHRREDKSTWWEYFRLLELTMDELVEERAPLAMLELRSDLSSVVKRSTVHMYAFPAQEYDLRIESKPIDPATKKVAGTVHLIDDRAGLIGLRRETKGSVPHPRALVPRDIVPSDDLEGSLFRLGTWVAAHEADGRGKFRAARDLLLRNPPRVGQAAGSALMRDGEEVLAAAARLALRLDHGVLPIQGPPGTGKTFTGAHTIIELVKAHKRVGITANSHKVITNLLDEICRLTTRPLRITQVGKEEGCADPRVTHIKEAAQLDLDDGAQIIAGTAWLWSREAMAESVDVLVIDEAGQMSLANAVACAPAANSVILLGDPQQLDQPRKGVHPPKVAVSVLEHLLGDDATMPPDRGLFIGETWRLHPRICAFTSSAFYDGRLTARADLGRQSIVGRGSGLRFLPTPHEGRRNRAPEEVAAIEDLVRELLRAGRYTTRDGETVPLTRDDILIVAPYNAQVGALAAAMPDQRVGTVDKFQGQQAPISIYSLTTSSADLAPRGMDFLYSPNRLNVATSRAKALTILVASPALLDPTCKTIEQMKLVNALCRYVEHTSGD